MPNSRVVVGVVGPSGGCTPAMYQDATAIGAALANAGAVVLTGGYPTDPPSTVKQGALMSLGRQISIRPARPVANWYPEHEGRRLVLDTTLTNHERNLLTGQIPDALIAIPGGPGTLSEVACALAAARPVIFLGERPSVDAAMDAQLRPIEGAVNGAWKTAYTFMPILAGGLGTCPVAATVIEAVTRAVELSGKRARRWQWTLPHRPDVDQVLEHFGKAVDLLCYA